MDVSRNGNTPRAGWFISWNIPIWKGGINGGSPISGNAHMSTTAFHLLDNGLHHHVVKGAQNEAFFVKLGQHVHQLELGILRRGKMAGGDHAIWSHRCP